MAMVARVRTARRGATMTLGLVSWWLPCVAAGLLACGTDAGGGGGGGGGDDRDGGGAGNGQAGGSGPGGAGGDPDPGGTTDAGPEPDALPLDVTPPDVFFRSPFDGATVSGVVEVVAEATDDRAVARRWCSALDGAEQATVVGRAVHVVVGHGGPDPRAVRPELRRRRTPRATRTRRLVEVQVAGACRADGNCPPADVRIITPVDQAVVCGQFNIEAAATDDDLARIEFMVDNRPVGVAERSPFAVVWNTEGFDNGLHTITALAIDSADQRAFARVEVEVRNEPGVVCRQAPNINIVQPADGAFLNGQVPLEADASDDGVVVSVEFSVDNGRLDVVESVPWRSAWDTALFDEGAHTVKAKATDDTNDTATTQVQVTVDRTAPTVEVLTPSIGETFADRVPFALDVADNFAIDHVEVRLGGPDGQVLATLNVGPWEGELDTSAVASGEHELSAVVHDKVGLTSTASVDIRLDRAPTVSFVGPGAGATLAGATTVEVSADDDLGVQSIELYVDDQLVDERAGQRFAEFRWEPPYRRGEHTLRAVATDNGGQTAEASLRVMVDHPFEVTITSPRDAQTVADTVTVNAETRDDDGQTQRVEFFVDGNLVGTDVTAPYEVDVDTTALPDGDRRLRARALSDNGQEAEATVTVRVNNCDRDDDGYLGCGGADCDDRAFNVNPDAADRVGDGADRNCDDLDGVDDDGDGVASIGSGGADCDDETPLRRPGLLDTVGDGLDNDCDGVDGVDADGDGYASVASLGDDCNDGDEVINPRRGGPGRRRHRPELRRRGRRRRRRRRVRLGGVAGRGLQRRERGDSPLRGRPGRRRRGPELRWRGRAELRRLQRLHGGHRERRRLQPRGHRQRAALRRRGRLHPERALPGRRVRERRGGGLRRRRRRLHGGALRAADRLRAERLRPTAPRARVEPARAALAACRSAMAGRVGATAVAGRAATARRASRATRTARASRCPPWRAT
jgi:hypothetical protein